MEQSGPAQQHARRDIRAVRESDRDDSIALQRIRLDCGFDKVREVGRASREIFLIEHAFTDATEESERATLIHLAPRTQQRRSRKKPAPEPHEIVFVASSAVQ